MGIPIWIALPSLLACSGLPFAGDSGNAAQAEPTPACSTFVACAAIVAPGELSAVQESYGVGGSCWEDPAGAEDCNARCIDGLADMQLAHPDVDACFAEVGNLTPCGLQPGRWTVTPDDNKTRCTAGAVFDMAGSVDLRCDAGRIVIAWDYSYSDEDGASVEGSTAATCDWTGAAWDCDWRGFWSASVEFDERGGSFAGSWVTERGPDCAGKLVGSLE